MPIFRTLFILLITVPLLEIYILIGVGNLIGALPTVSLVVLTAILGAALLRLQGLQTVARVQAKLQRGEIPATEMLGGVILLISGVLLLTPGFFTDIFGFLCLLPRFRNYLAATLLKHLLQRNRDHQGRYSVTLDGEHWEDEERKHLRD